MARRSNQGVPQYEGFRVEFCFALWSPSLEDLGGGHSNTVEQCPNKAVDLPAGVNPRDEIDRLEAEAELGTFHTAQIPPHWPGNDTQAPKWVVKCHSGSTAERLEWIKTIQ